MTLRRKITLLLALAAATIGAASDTAAARTLAVADAEHSLGSEWANYSCQDRSRVRQVGHPAAQGKRAYRLEYRPGDDSYGARCEIGMGNPSRSPFPLFHEGDEEWISFQVYLPDDYPIDTPMWNVFFQIHQEGDGGCPPVSMEVQNGQFKLYNSARNTYVLDTREKWSGPAVANHWVKFTIHLKNSTSDDRGFVQLFGDLDGNGMKELMPLTHMHTMTKYPNGKPMTNHARVGIYRNPNIRGTAHILFDGFTIATGRSDAEDVAFGGADPNPGADDDGSGDDTPKAKRSRVWLKTSGSLRSAGLAWPHVLRVYGGVRPGRRGARRTVLIQVRHDGRWEWLARSWVHRNGRFYIAANVDPAITGPRVKLRAVVRGVGHSRPLVAHV
jgi:Polysaccharide lyase